MNQKAQGTIEYLVIIAIVVVIALVVVGLLLQILGNFGTMSETSVKTSWKSAEPWAITDWTAVAGTGTTSNLKLVLRNNSAETLTFTSITAGTTSASSYTISNMAPGATTTVDTNISCTPAGSKYSIPKLGVYITYNTPTITVKKQYATADIVGTC